MIAAILAHDAECTDFKYFTFLKCNVIDTFIKPHSFLSPLYKGEDMNSQKWAIVEGCKKFFEMG